MDGRSWLACVALSAACAGDDTPPAAPSPGMPRSSGGPTAVPDVAPEVSVHVKLLSPGVEPRRALRYRPAVGAEQAMSLLAKIDVAMTMGGHPMFVHNVDSTSRVSLRVSALDGDSIVIAMTIVEMDIPNYDPTDLAVAPKLAGVEGTFTITDRGVLVEQDLPFLEAISGAQEELYLPDYLFVLPEEAVGIGAKWEVHSLTLRNGIGVRSVDTHELVALDGDIGRTTSLMVMDSWPQQVPTFAQDPITVFEVLSFRSSGASDARFDLARSLPLLARSEFEFSTQMRVRRIEMVQNIEMTMKAMLETRTTGNGGKPR